MDLARRRRGSGTTPSSRAAAGSPGRGADTSGSSFRRHADVLDDGHRLAPPAQAVQARQRRLAQLPEAVDLRPSSAAVTACSASRSAWCKRSDQVRRGQRRASAGVSASYSTSSTASAAGGDQGGDRRRRRPAPASAGGGRSARRPTGPLARHRLGRAQGRVQAGEAQQHQRRGPAGSGTVRRVASVNRASVPSEPTSSRARSRCSGVEDVVRAGSRSG